MRAGLVLPYQEPSSTAGISPPRAFDRWLARQLQARLAPARVRLELWDGTSPWTGGEALGEILALDRGAVWGLLTNPDLHFGEAYTAGRIVVRGDFARIVLALTRLHGPSDVGWQEKLGLWLAPANDLI